ncbi:MAG: hypothetical protein JWN95_2177 [Frankiales bacterium]|nr:hypothetical protein [Frankiales bacterium]
MSLVGFVLFFGLIALWSVATPPFAAPDEPVQAVKAAATAHGEFLGRGTADPAKILFQVPGTLARAPNPGCFAFRPTVAASCLAHWTADDSTSPATSYVGRYPPLYYLIVGLPSVITSSTSVLLLMRLVSAALSAVFLAAAFVSASQFCRRRWVLLGTAFALTPMELFLAGVINPSGLEISSALCLWTSGLGLVLRDKSQPATRLVVWSTLSAAILVQLRGLSPLLLAVIGVSLALVAGRDRLRVIAHRAGARVGLVAVAACSVFSVSWVLFRHGLRVQASGRPVSSDAGSLAVLKAAAHVGLAYTQLIGNFGWLDTPMPRWCYALWALALVALGVAALAGRSIRLSLLLAALVVATVAIPTLLAYSQAHRVGIVGQGRYILPVAVGLPVLAGYAASRRLERSRWSVPGMIVGGVVVAAIQVTGYVVALARYRNGTGHAIWTLDAEWEPPLPWLVGLGLFVTLQLLLFAWWLTLSAGEANAVHTVNVREMGRRG